MNNLFVDAPQLRVFDFLTEIAYGTNVSYNSLNMFFPKLTETGILVKTRRIGKSDYFKFNRKNNFVQNMIKLDWMLVKRNLFRRIKVPVK